MMAILIVVVVPREVHASTQVVSSYQWRCLLAVVVAMQKLQVGELVLGLPRRGLAEPSLSPQQLRSCQQLKHPHHTTPQPLLTTS